MAAASRTLVHRIATLGALLSIVGCALPERSPLARAVGARDDVPLDEAQRDANLRSFEEMWLRVSNSYFNVDRLAGFNPAGGNGGRGGPSTTPTPTATGTPAGTGASLVRVNWPAVRDEFRPRVERAVTQRAARDAMRDALARLGETHFAILPSDLYAQEGQASFRPDASDVGLTIRLLADDAVVTAVRPGSPAARAGVRPGWLLLDVDGVEVNPLVRRLRDALPPDRMADVNVLDYLDRMVNAGVGRRVALTFRDGAGRRQRVSLVGAAPDAEVAQFGNLPAMSLRVEARRLPGSDVLYFSCGVFLDPTRVLGAFQGLIADHADARGLVIDLRGNPGGLGSMAPALMGFLIDGEERTIGSLVRRDGTIPFVVRPRQPRFAGPVAVLVDGMSMSTSEILARGLQETGRGRVFGQPTPGAALPSVVVRLPNGDRFQYAVADYVSAGGGRLEGVGVTPDEPVPLDRLALLAGRDAVLEAATAWIARAGK